VGPQKLDGLVQELARQTTADVWNLGHNSPELQGLSTQLQQTVRQEIQAFSSHLRYVLVQRVNQKDRSAMLCLAKLERYLTAYLVKGLFEGRFHADAVEMWIGTDKLIPSEAFLGLLYEDRSYYKTTQPSRIWKPLFHKYPEEVDAVTNTRLSSNERSRQGYRRIVTLLNSLSQTASQPTAAKLQELAAIFNEVIKVGHPYSVPQILQEAVGGTSTYQSLDRRLDQVFSNLPPVPDPGLRLT